MVANPHDRPTELGAAAGIFQAVARPGSSNLQRVASSLAESTQRPGSRWSTGASVNLKVSTHVSQLADEPARSFTTPAAKTPETSRDTFEFAEFARSAEGQARRAEMAEARLEKAVGALIACRLHGREDDPTGLRDVLFDLYEAGILTRDQVRLRGQLDSADFHDELLVYRRRKTRA
jgi:hypothetical protein